MFDLAYFQIIGLMKEELLAAVPLFIFMGFITEQAGLMERLFTAFRLLLAPVRGSLYLVVILTSTVFAMATGIVGAAVTVLGIMAAPIMVKAGYDAKLSAGTITAGGTLGILIPPSVMLVVMGPVLGVSVADLYAAAFGPGFLLAGMYIVYLMTRAFLNPKLGPPVPIEERVHSLPVMLREVLIGTVPLLGADHGDARLDPGRPRDADRSRGRRRRRRADPDARLRPLHLAGLPARAARHHGDVQHGAAAGGDLEHLRRGVRAARHRNWITQSLLSLEMPPTLMLIVILVLIFLLGWPFEWPAIVLVFLPIFYPVVAAMKIDLVWFGALVAVVLQTAFLSPPVAMSAYYLKQVVKDWSLATIYGGMFQFMIIQVICIGAAGRVPADRDLVSRKRCRKRPARRRSPTTTRRSWTASARRPRSRKTA